MGETLRRSSPIQDLIDRITEALPELPGDPYLTIGLGVVLLILLLWLLLRRQPKAVEAFDGESGHVMVSRRAITEVARRACDTMPGIGRCKTRIKFRRESLVVDVRIRLVAGHSLSEVCSELDHRLNRTLRDNLGIQKLGDINIMVTGFSGDPTAEESTAFEDLDSSYVALDDQDRQ